MFTLFVALWCLVILLCIWLASGQSSSRDNEKRRQAPTWSPRPWLEKLDAFLWCSEDSQTQSSEADGKGVLYKNNARICYSLQKLACALLDLDADLHVMLCSFLARIYPRCIRLLALALRKFGYANGRLHRQSTDLIAVADAVFAAAKQCSLAQAYTL